LETLETNMNPPFLPYQSELIISDNVSNIRGMGHTVYWSEAETLAK
jgi:hypothetical protein